MAEDGPNFNDEDDITWRWIGKVVPDPDPQSAVTYRFAAEVTRNSDGAKRKYKVGDFIYMTGDGKGEQWIAQVTEFVNDPSKKDMPMRCTVRWCYVFADMTDDAKLAVPDKPYRDEVFMSDHIDETGFNPITVIEGFAFLCATPGEFETMTATPPTKKWPLDPIRLCRAFYGYPLSADRVRRMAREELRFMEKHPSTEVDLFETSPLAPRGPTRRPRRSEPAPSSGAGPSSPRRPRSSGKRRSSTDGEVPHRRTMRKSVGLRRRVRAVSPGSDESDYNPFDSRMQAPGDPAAEGEPEAVSLGSTNLLNAMMDVSDDDDSFKPDATPGSSPSRRRSPSPASEAGVLSATDPSSQLSVAEPGGERRVKGPLDSDSDDSDFNPHRPNSAFSDGDSRSPSPSAADIVSPDRPRGRRDAGARKWSKNVDDGNEEDQVEPLPASASDVPPRRPNARKRTNGDTDRNGDADPQHLSKSVPGPSGSNARKRTNGAANRNVDEVQPAALDSIALPRVATARIRSSSNNNNDNNVEPSRNIHIDANPEPTTVVHGRTKPKSVPSKRRKRKKSTEAGSQPEPMDGVEPASGGPSNAAGGPAADAVMTSANTGGGAGRRGDEIIEARGDAKVRGPPRRIPDVPTNPVDASPALNDPDPYVPDPVEAQPDNLPRPRRLPQPGSEPLNGRDSNNRPKPVGSQPADLPRPPRRPQFRSEPVLRGAQKRRGWRPPVDHRGQMRDAPNAGGRGGPSREANLSDGQPMGPSVANSANNAHNGRPMGVHGSNNGTRRPVGGTGLRNAPRGQMRGTANSGRGQVRDADGSGRGNNSGRGQGRGGRNSGRGQHRGSFNAGRGQNRGGLNSGRGRNRDAPNAGRGQPSSNSHLNPFNNPASNNGHPFNGSSSNVGPSRAGPSGGITPHPSDMPQPETDEAWGLRGADAKQLAVERMNAAREADRGSRVEAVETWDEMDTLVKQLYAEATVEEASVYMDNFPALFKKFLDLVAELGLDMNMPMKKCQEVARMAGQAVVRDINEARRKKAEEASRKAEEEKREAEEADCMEEEEAAAERRRICREEDEEEKRVAAEERAANARKAAEKKKAAERKKAEKSQGQ